MPTEVPERSESHDMFCANEHIFYITLTFQLLIINVSVMITIIDELR